MAKARKPDKEIEQNQEFPQDGVIIGYLDSLLKEVGDESGNNASYENKSTPIDEPVSNSTIEENNSAVKREINAPVGEDPVGDLQVDRSYTAHVKSLEELKALNEQICDEETTAIAAELSEDKNLGVEENENKFIGLERQDNATSNSDETPTRKFKSLSEEQWRCLSDSALNRHENGRPFWAQGRFECLLFEVGSMTIAAPLVELGCIVRVSEKLTHMVGHPAWILGMYKNASMNYHALDTAMLIMADRYEEKYREEINYLVTIDNRAWGLACRNIHKSVSLEPGQVRWRQQKSQTRKWFAGTVVDHMCALIDVAALAAEVEFNYSASSK